MEDGEPFPRLMGNKTLHAGKLQQHLYDQMLAQSEFCDVTLVAGGIEMKAHWCVLVSCPYFQSLYDSGMKEKQAGKINISVGKPVAVRSAVSFLYTGVLEISYGSVRDILEVADYLQIDDLKLACTTYLTSVEVTVHNCVSLSLLASLYNLDNYQKVFDYVRGHLPEVMLQEDTLSLTPESVLEILRDSSLSYVSVEDYFNFIVKWTEHDPENREQFFEEMFCELDLRKISREFLENTVEVLPFVVSSDKCKVHVLNVKMKHMAGLLQEESSKDVILLIGGCGVGQYMSSFFISPFFPLSDIISVNHVYGYVIKENRWTELAPLPYTMRRPFATFNKSTNSLFVFDGSGYGTLGGDNDTLCLFRYNILEKTWTNVRFSTPENVQEIGVEYILACNNRLYVVASGRFQPEGGRVSEWYVFVFRVSEDLTRSELKVKLFPRTTRTQLSACVVNDRYVCVLGFKCGTVGRPAHSRSKIVKFVYLDSHTGRRSESSKGAYFEPLMLPLRDELYLTRPGCYRFRKFSFTSKRWSTVKDLILPNPVEESARTDFIFTTYDNKLFMFGGKSALSLKPIDNACCYDFEEKVWKSLQAVPKAVTNCGVVVASLPQEQIRCHIDCPHCKYHTVRSQASYQIDYPADEEDEDEDISYEDDDDIYSDYWDDDMYDYDNIPDYDWF